VKTRYLPGLEDVPAPPGLAGRDLALWRLARFPAKRLVLEAVFAIAGSRSECLPTTAEIRRRIAELGHAPPTEANINIHLRQLEADFGLISRHPDRRAKSRRRLVLELAKGADDWRPRAPMTGAQGRRSMAPKGADRWRPPVAQVQSVQSPATEPIPPLNSIQNSEEENVTLRAPIEHKGDGAPPRLRHCEIMERLRLAAAQASDAPSPPPRPPTVAEQRHAAARPHIETVDRLRRLADPCGPEAVEAAAAQAAELLGDQKSIGYYRQVCERVRRGEIPAKVAIGAFRQARSPTANRPGAVFAAFIREHSPPGAQKKPTPGATRQSSPGIGQVSPFRPSGPSEYKYTREGIL
jgi:hypothetical protein